ncbi:MAG: M48 family metalloprotease [Bdellovibrionota bacterium]
MKNTNLTVALVAVSLMTGCSLFGGGKKIEADAQAAANEAGESVEGVEEAVSQATSAQAGGAGRVIAAEVLRQHPLIADKPLLEYVNKVGQYVALHLNATEKSVRCADGKTMTKPAKGIRVGIIGIDQGDAFAVPGGFIFIPTGLIAKLRSEDQLAGVIAHEILHTMCGDDVPSNVAAASTDPGSLVNEAMTKPYSRPQLNAADRAAVVSLFRAGYYPNHYIRHVYENEEVGKHSAGKARSPAMQKDVAKLSSKIEKTVDARRSRYEKFQRAVLMSASKASSPSLN